MSRALWLLAEMSIGCIVLVGLGTSGVVAHAQAQAAAQATTTTETNTSVTPAAPVGKSCTVNTSAPNLAETALNKGDFASAETLFLALLSKSADNESAHEGLVRAMLAQDKVADAAKYAESWAAAAPASSMALTALGDVRLRQGDPRIAFTQFQKAARGSVQRARLL